MVAERAVKLTPVERDAWLQMKIGLTQMLAGQVQRGIKTQVSAIDKLLNQVECTSNSRYDP